MLSKKRLMKLQPLIAISTTAIALIITLLLSVFLISRFSKVINTNQVESTNVKMDALSNTIESYLEEMIVICGFMEDMIKNHNGNITPQVEEQFVTMYTSRKDIEAISIFDSYGGIISTWPSYDIRENYRTSDEDWFKKTARQKNIYYFQKPTINIMFKDNYKKVISVCTKVTLDESKLGYNKYYIIKVDVDYDKFEKVLEDTVLGNRGYAYIVDGNNDIISHPFKSAIFFNDTQEQSLPYVYKAGNDENYTIDSTGNIITKKTLNYVDWKIIGVAFFDDTIVDFNDIIQQILMVLVIAICITILSSWYISSIISLPIIKLQKSMNKVTEGDLDIRIDLTSGETEVLQLANSFNHMLTRLQRLMKEKEEQQEMRRKTELEALQSQINPHFLYNTLDSIVWMAETGNGEEVIEMVNALATFFRISISKGKGMITLEDELTHAQNYMLIQKHRYSDKFEYSAHADDDILDTMVPKLIIQPLLENALYHGIEYLMDKGEISVVATSDDNNVYIKISDNGIGMDEESLSKILTGKSSKRNGIGVRNVNERIKIIFGKEYGLSYLSELDEGTTVTIRLPKIKYEVVLDEK